MNTYTGRELKAYSNVTQGYLELEINKVYESKVKPYRFKIDELGLLHIFELMYVSDLENFTELVIVERIIKFNGEIESLAYGHYMNEKQAIKDLTGGVDGGC